MWSEDFLASVIATALKNGGDYADVFIEETQATIITLSDKKIESIRSGIVQGAGIRVISGKNYTYLYANDVDEKRLMELAMSSAEARSIGKSISLQGLKETEHKVLHSYSLYPEDVDIEKKVAMVRRGSDAARAYSSLIDQAFINYSDTTQNVTIANSEGKCIHDERVRTRYIVQTVATKGSQKENGYYAPGKSLGFEFFDLFSPEKIANESARIACLLLDADYAPSGTMPVIIDNEFGGVIFHEACGHALEATSVADDASVFSGKLGTQIASPCVSAIDDGTIPNEWGSAAYDDEANPTQKNVLIENGILKSYLVDKLGQVKMGIPANGCCRRESYKYAPTSRMSNTYIAPGTHKVEELISNTDHGLFCKKMGGGSVNPSTSDFNFAVTEAYLIEGGKLTKPVKYATLIGKGSEILKNIDMVADNMDFGTGMCGSSSGSVPANVGQGAIRVHGLVIGGRE